MGAQKIHSLLSASWKTRKARDVIQSECEDLITRGANGVLVQVQSLKNWEAGGLSSSPRPKAEEPDALMPKDMLGWMS